MSLRAPRREETPKPSLCKVLFLHTEFEETVHRTRVHCRQLTVMVLVQFAVIVVLLALLWRDR